MQTRSRTRHERRKAAVLPLCVILILFILLQAGCGTFELNSLWRQNAVNIDGKTSDWLGKLTYLEEYHFSVGIMNDSDYLYICLIADNILLPSQIIRQGFFVWFDPEGGKEKAFGVKFPLGMMAMRSPRDKAQAPVKRPATRQEFDPSMRENLDFLFDELEILGPNQEVLERLKLEDIKGIEAQFLNSSGLMSYEIKIPLEVSPELSHTYAIRTQPGKTIGIGFETPKLDRVNMRAPGGMSGRGGGMGGRGGMGGIGGRGGMAGRGGRGGMQPQMERLNVWISSTLAVENNELKPMTKIQFLESELH